LKKIKTGTIVALLAILFLADLWPVNKRYLGSKNFVTKKEDRTPFKASTADLVILQDKDLSYRVLNLSLSPLQDASTSYFHKSIGGYHGAKMRRFQELYDHHVQDEIMRLIGTFQKRPVPAALDSTLATLNALNLLNTRYFIYNAEAPPLVNKSELGNAWFIDEIRTVNNADEEISAIGTIDPSAEAIVDEKFNSYLDSFDPEPDSSGKIELTEYRANYLKYSSSAKSEQFAVFSEVYYDKGWQAYIDGKPVPHIRADYLFRSMRIPAGTHVIEFKFHPRSYYIGEKVSLASSFIMLLLAIGLFYKEYRKNNK
jgi:hypothetical protein